MSNVNFEHDKIHLQRGDRIIKFQVDGSASGTGTVIFPSAGATVGAASSIAADDITVGNAAVSIITSSGAISIGGTANDEVINVGNSDGAVNIKSTGAGAITIGNSSGGAVAIASDADSSFTVTSGNLTLSTATSGNILISSAGTASEVAIIAGGPVSLEGGKGTEAEGLILSTSDSNGTVGIIAMSAGNGTGAAVAGGAVTISGGQGGANAVGGAVSIFGGQGGTASGNGAVVNIVGGAANGGNGNGGAVTINGGLKDGTGVNGPITIGATENAGVVTLGGTAATTTVSGNTTTISSATTTSISSTTSMTISSGTSITLSPESDTADAGHLGAVKYGDNVYIYPFDIPALNVASRTFTAVTQLPANSACFVELEMIVLKGTGGAASTGGYYNIRSFFKRGNSGDASIVGANMTSTLGDPWANNPTIAMGTGGAANTLTISLESDAAEKASGHIKIVSNADLGRLLITTTTE
jgi:hypothetical protein